MKTKAFIAVFDGEVLRPQAPLDLEPNARYHVTIEGTEAESLLEKQQDARDL